MSQIVGENSAHHSKYLIAALIALGVAGAGGGWLYHRHVQQRAIALWGGEAAELIVAAPKVELLRLEPDDTVERSKGGTVAWRGRHWRIAARTDAAQAPGMPHLRHRLVHDTSFDWSIAPDARVADWQYALRFSSDDRQATVLFDLEQRCTALAETGAMASIAPIGRGLAEMFDSMSAPASPTQRRTRSPNESAPRR